MNSRLLVVADWFAVYQESDGKLLSLGTVIANPLRAGVAKVNLGATRPEDVRWNPATLVFDPRPTPPPDVDRVEEFIAVIGNGIPAKKITTIRDELRILLGSVRFRPAGESRNLP